MYHNPNALVPVDPSLFPGIAHYHIVDGEALWFGAPFRVLYSSTMTFDLLGREKSMEGLFPSDDAETGESQD